MRPVRKFEERPSWSLTGAKGRDPNIISSIYIDPVEEEKLNQKLMAIKAKVIANEVRYRELLLEDAELAVVAFGTAGRIAQSAVKAAREEGIKVGLFRPISLFPFPYDRVKQVAEQVKAILVVEMNSGQMVEDVRLGAEGKTPVTFYGRMGGVVPMPDEVLEEIRKLNASLSSAS